MYKTYIILIPKPFFGLIHIFRGITKNSRDFYRFLYLFNISKVPPTALYRTPQLFAILGDGIPTAGAPVPPPHEYFGDLEKLRRGLTQGHGHSTKNLSSSCTPL